VIELLRRFTPKFMQWDGAAQQVKSVLSKILLCRTALLKGHLYQCRGCNSEVNVYNSCTDRHCPQCGGARRADWMARNTEVVLPGVPYFQVVFTLPDKLSSLILGNRSELYSLLFQSAWKALDRELRRTGKFHPAALMVLHTWNQQLEHHPHLHALVPGAGPATDGSGWKVAKHPKHRRRKKPYLTDVKKLGREFRKQYLLGLKRLLRQGKLRIGGSVAFLDNPLHRKTFMEQLAAIDWNVYSQGPPRGKSDPNNVVKYLAGYLTGGPIADSRIIEANDEEVRFWARPKQSGDESVSRKHRRKKHRGMNAPRTYRLTAREFMQRWTLHILPKSFTRSRAYGGYHGTKRAAYLKQCRQLLAPLDTPEELPPQATEIAAQGEEASGPKCPHCDSTLELIDYQKRPSWRVIFEREIYRTSGYSPLHHLGSGSSGGRGGRAPPFQPPPLPGE
jgi:predicted RNA-binding Zn-ribbon protein involved in translation (DUF1610 family)